LQQKIDFFGFNLKKKNQKLGSSIHDELSELGDRESVIAEGVN